MHFYTSPFFVVPLLAVVFLSGILWGTLTGREAHDEHAHDAGHKPDAH